jgi:hypothetical protein
LAKTPKEFEERISSLYLDINQDGKILFDPQRYAHRRLAALQRLMAETGLNRKKSRGGGGMEMAAKAPATLGTSVEGMINAGS